MIASRALPIVRLLSCMAGLFYGVTAMAECPDSCKSATSVEQLEKCKTCQYMLKPEAFEKLLIQAKDPPNSWSDSGKVGSNDAKGSINTGGAGSMSTTALTEPGKIPPDSGAGSGGGPGGGGGGGGGGDSGDSGDGGKPPNCVPPYKTPDGCTMNGVRDAFKAATETYSCGASAEMYSDLLTMAHGANAGLVVNHNDPTLYAYSVSGTDLVYRTKSKIPDRYCIEKEVGSDPITGAPIIEIVEVPITIKNQYIAVSDNTKYATIAIEEDEDFIIMKRNGNSLNFTPVVGGCPIGIKNLVSPPPPNFGDIVFRHEGGSRCLIENFFPGGADPENCLKYRQDLNMRFMQIYVGPKGTISVGSIQGGNSNSKFTVRGQAGEFVAVGEDKKLVYTGTSAILGGGSIIYLGIGASPVNEQAFINGAAFDLNDNYTLQLVPPGRIKLSPNGAMQLIDGGTIVDSGGTTIRVISAMGFVQFEKDKPIRGSSFGDIVVEKDTLIPTAPDGAIQRAHDTTLDDVCPTE